MTRSSSMCLESFDDIVEDVDGAASLEVVLTIMDLDIYSQTQTLRRSFFFLFDDSI